MQEVANSGPLTIEGFMIVVNRFDVHINPPPAGGAVIRPLRFFAGSEKTAARSAAKFAIAVQPTIWHIKKKKR